MADTLGWAYYRIGNYEDAVKNLERAIDLKPEDPTINDHLGDAYWRVGRTLEAKFQWAHARDLKPEPEDLPKIEAKIENKAKLVVVDPRFTRTASVADVYAPIRPGTDIAFLSGVIRYLLDKDLIQHEHVRAYTNASLIVKDGFGFEDGLFTGYDEAKRAYDKSSWDYDKDDQGYANNHEKGNA